MSDSETVGNGSYHSQVQALHELAQRQGRADPFDWQTVAAHAKRIADNLKTDELRTELGSTTLLASCGKLLQISTDERLDADATTGKTELLRVVGNMCFENDVNRKSTDEASVLKTVLALLRRILGLKGSAPDRYQEWTVTELKLVRASVGTLLNMTLKYEPIRKQLRTSDSLVVLTGIVDQQRIRSRRPHLYRINKWAEVPKDRVDEWRARVEIGSLISTWAMNIIEEVTSEDKSTFPQDGISALASIVLSAAHVQPPADNSELTWDSEEISEHVETDLDLLTNAASLLEALSIDLETAKQALGLGVLSDDEGSLLSSLMDFVELSTPPKHWIAACDDPDQVQKAFSNIKSAVIRAIVEAPNADDVMIQLFALGNKSWLVVRLVRWLDEAQAGREDLLICAAHMLAALARRDDHCISLVHQYGVAAPLARIVAEKARQQFEKTTNVRPGEVTQVLYGVVSLLRHLAIPVPNKTILGDADVISPVSALLQRELDVVGPLQNSVVGLLKHLTAANVPNSLRVLELAPVTATEIARDLTNSALASNSAPIDLLLALISRTDDVRLRSEATRVLVNVVRTLFSTKPLATTELAAASPITPTLASSVQSNLNVEETLKRRGKPQVVRREVVEALGEMVRLSEKYPMLINEAVVGLTLLAGSGGQGAILVLETLLKEHTSPVPATKDEPSLALRADSSSSDISSRPRSTSRTASLAVSAAGDPPASLDMLVNWLGSYCLQTDGSTSTSALGSLVSNSVQLSTGDGAASTSPKTGEASASPSTAAAATAAAAAAVSSSTSSSPSVRPEMVGNVCALLITCVRGAQVARADAGLLARLKARVVGPLIGCVERQQRDGAGGGGGVQDDGPTSGGAATDETRSVQLTKTVERCLEVVQER